MKKLFVLFVSLIFSLSLVFTGCDGEDDDSGGLIPGAESGGGSVSGPGVTVLRPSPCQRIYGAMDINLSPNSPDKVETAYVTLNNLVVAVFDGGGGYATTLPASDLPVDGSYILEAVVVYKDGTSVSDEVNIRIDRTAPFVYNYLVLDSAADPMGLGGKPGALFRVDVASGLICTLASSKMFSSPSAMAIQADGTILVTDLGADMDGDGPGVGTIFRVLPDRYNNVTVFKSSGLFRGPVGIDIDPVGGVIYVVDYDADPLNLTASDKGPGAVFAINPNTLNVTTVMSNMQLVSPIGVTIDSSGDLLIADADANPNDPVDSQYHGSAWKYVTSTGDLQLLSGSTSFITPFKLLETPGGDLLLADSGYNSQGALFEIVPGVSTTVLVDSYPLLTPAGMVYDAETGTYLIADRNADTLKDGNRGAILRYDPVGGSTTFFILSDRFVEPFDVKISLD